MVKVHFTTQLRSFTGGVAELEVEVGSVRALINLLEERFPGLGERLSTGTSVVINGEIIQDALYEPIPDGADVHFMEALSGGRGAA